MLAAGTWRVHLAVIGRLPRGVADRPVGSATGRGLPSTPPECPRRWIAPRRSGGRVPLAPSPSLVRHGNSARDGNRLASTVRHKGLRLLDSLLLALARRIPAPVLRALVL